MYLENHRVSYTHLWGVKINITTTSLTASVGNAKTILLIITISAILRDSETRNYGTCARTKVRFNGTSIPRLGAETYRKSWEIAHQNDLDWVLLTSWNEWA